MDRGAMLEGLRERLKAGDVTIGSWMQLRDPSVAEIMGRSGYDWVALDLEHGQFSLSSLPDLFRALESGDTLPLVRLALGDDTECKQVLDAGAAGVIVPMIRSAEHLLLVRSACCWPDAGTRGVGFSRANLFGKDFENYRSRAQNPLLVAMVEHIDVLTELDRILEVSGLDALLIGPYDLSASLGQTGQLDHPEVKKAMTEIRRRAASHGIPCGVHVLEPSRKRLEAQIEVGDRFLAFSMDAVFLWRSAEFRSDRS